MREVREGAWWCAHCSNNIEGICIKYVPYYASSLHCKYWRENTVSKPLKKKRFNLKKILVEVL